MNREIEWSMDQKFILEVKDSCSMHLDFIFNDLVEKELIHPESKFFGESKERTLNTCFQSLYPLAEFSDNFSESYFDFFQHNSLLFVYAFFLDQSLDSLENNPSTRVRSSQISSYLLFNYHEWLIKTDDPDITLSFYKYYSRQANYCIVEKKWLFPEIYLTIYGSSDKIFMKEILLLFPLQLYKRNLFSLTPYALLENLFVNYFSFILLADDLIDLSFDISHHCLTYPIVKYFELERELPHSHEDMLLMMPDFVLTLQEFLNNIKQLETEIGQRSLIINNTTDSFKSELRRVGVDL